MNITLDTTYVERDSTVPNVSEFRMAVDFSEPQQETETQLSDADYERWVWTFEQLKNADLGLSFEEKVKLFCEASNPDEIEEMIYSSMHEQTIIPLAA